MLSGLFKHHLVTKQKTAQAQHRAASALTIPNFYLGGEVVVLCVRAHSPLKYTDSSPCCSYSVVVVGLTCSPLWVAYVVGVEHFKEQFKRIFILILIT